MVAVRSSSLTMDQLIVRERSPAPLAPRCTAKHGKVMQGRRTPQLKKPRANGFSAWMATRSLSPLSPMRSNEFSEDNVPGLQKVHSKLSRRRWRLKKTRHVAAPVLPSAIGCHARITSWAVGLNMEASGLIPNCGFFDNPQDDSKTAQFMRT